VPFRTRPQFTKGSEVKKLMMIALACSAFLSGCAVVPAPVVYETRAAKMCPPGQAKKGNCAPAYEERHEHNFCPPGPAKKGNC
jgi:hypothetical protein